MHNRENVEFIIKSVLTELGITTIQPKRYVYGQKGIAELFNCSIATASRILKSGKIKDAVSHIGRKIVIDADKALELAKQKSGGRKWK